MKLHFQFPQECKDTELSNLGSPSRKFQQRPTNPRPSKHWQIRRPYMSSPAGPRRKSECDRKFSLSACCRPETLDLHRARCGSHPAPSPLIVRLASLAPATRTARHGGWTSVREWLSDASLTDSSLNRSPLWTRSWTSSWRSSCLTSKSQRLQQKLDVRVRKLKVSCLRVCSPCGARLPLSKNRSFGW